MTIQSKVDTIVKTRLPVAGEQLLKGEKLNVYKGQAFQTKNITPWKNDHFLIDFVNAPIERGYIYRHHWTYPYERVSIPMTYYWQRDNPSGDGLRECCGTSNAMMLNYLLKGALDGRASRSGISQPESIYLDVLARYGDTTNHDANTKALREFGVESFWSTSLTLEDLYLSLRNNIPVVAGLDYNEHGHIVCLNGFDITANTVTAHDPNGSRLGATNQWISILPEAGKYDTYFLDTLCRLLFPQDSLMWGRIVTSIEGKATIFAG